MQAGTDTPASGPTHWERAVGFGVVALCVCVVVGIMNPGMRFLPLNRIHFGDLFANTTTNGGDMGAHVWWPWYLKEHWFGHFRLSGWSPDWYAGFPVGQYYFPLPAVLVALVDAIPFVSYNVAFKLVTVSGAVLLPASAYSFARGLRAPWPAPPAFAVAATGMLVQTRDNWQIYGGNIASTLAGEFSFTLALALGLFALGALGKTLDTGKRPWLPAVLIAASAMSHVVVAMVLALFALLLFLTRRPARTWRLALPVGVVAVALTAVWSLPLIARHSMTQSMRYEKVVPAGNWKLWGFVAALLPGPVERTIEGIVRGLGTSTNAAGEAIKQPLWLPWWIWLLAGVAIVAAGFYRRRSTLVLLIAAIVLGVLFVQWPEHAVWNTRFLPFWLLTWGFIAAMGATEILRWIAAGCRARRPVDPRGRPLRRARPGVDRARRRTPRVPMPKRTKWSPRATGGDRYPGGSRPRRCGANGSSGHARRVSAIAMAVLVGVIGAWSVNRAWEARNDNPNIAIQSWARWNYSGYERKPSWPEYSEIFADDGHPAARTRALGAVGARQLGSDQLLRHVPRARAAAVLDQGSHRLDGRPLLRVVGDDLVPLPDRERAGGAPVEPGARARVRIARRLRPRCEAPADARGPLLHGVDAGSRGEGRREPGSHAGRVDRRFGRSRPEGLEGLRGRGLRARAGPRLPTRGRAAARGHDVVVLRPAPAEQRHPRSGARRVGVHGRGLVQGRRPPRHAVGGIGTRRSGRASTRPISPPRRGPGSTP